MVDKLEACPFCGGEATTEHLENGSWSAGCIEAGGEPCIAFQMLSTYPTEGQAIAAWNRRTPAIDMTTIAERFCATPLPDSVCADLCATHQGPGRYGTHLLTVAQAKEMLAAVLPTPTEDARERVKVLEEALEPFAALAGTFDAVSRRYLGVGIDGHLGSTSLPVGGDEARKTCGITVDDLIRARTALGNKETDRHG